VPDGILGGLGSRAACGLIVLFACLALFSGRAAAGPGEQYKPCYWQGTGCFAGSIPGFGTRNSGFYAHSTGLAVSGQSLKSKSLRVYRQGVGYLGWWYSTNAYHDVAFSGSYTHQHWCGNNTPAAQTQWCDMWLNGI
jgi:hypothetical protein